MQKSLLVLICAAAGWWRRGLTEGMVVAQCLALLLHYNHMHEATCTMGLAIMVGWYSAILLSTHDDVIVHIGRNNYPLSSDLALRLGDGLVHALVPLVSWYMLPRVPLAPYQSVFALVAYAAWALVYDAVDNEWCAHMTPYTLPHLPDDRRHMDVARFLFVCVCVARAVCR